MDTHFLYLIAPDQFAQIFAASCLFTRFPPILDRLKITADQWRINTSQFEAIHPKRFNRLTPQLDTG